MTLSTWSMNMILKDPGEIARWSIGLHPEQCVLRERVDRAVRAMLLGQRVRVGQLDADAEFLLDALLECDDERHQRHRVEESFDAEQRSIRLQSRGNRKSSLILYQQDTLDDEIDDLRRLCLRSPEHPQESKRLKNRCKASSTYGCCGDQC